MQHMFVVVASAPDRTLDVRIHGSEKIGFSPEISASRNRLAARRHTLASSAQSQATFSISWAKSSNFRMTTLAGSILMEPSFQAKKRCWSDPDSCPIGYSTLLIGRG